MSDTNTNTQAAPWPYPGDYTNQPVQPLGPYDFEALSAVMNSWVREVE